MYSVIANGEVLALHCDTALRLGFGQRQLERSTNNIHYSLHLRLSLISCLSGKLFDITVISQESQSVLSVICPPPPHIGARGDLPAESNIEYHIYRVPGTKGYMITKRSEFDLINPSRLSILQEDAFNHSITRTASFKGMLSDPKSASHVSIGHVSTCMLPA